MHNFHLVIYIYLSFISLFFDCIVAVGAVGRPNSKLNCVIMESRYIIGAKTVQLAGVKCINVLKGNLLKCIM